DATLERLVGRVTAAGERSAAEHGVGLAVTRESYSPGALFAGALRDRLSAVLGGAPHLPPGAGHDAGILSAHVPAAMLFVRNPTGVSHSPAEHAEATYCVAGVEAFGRSAAGAGMPMTRYFTDYAWLGGAQVAERVLIDVTGD